MKPGTDQSTAKMKKILYLLIPALICVMGAEAQVKLGILGGVNSANVLEHNSIPGWDSTVKKYLSSRTAIQLGVIVEMPLGHKGFFFQPAIIYTSKGRQYSKLNDSAAIYATDTVYAKQSLNIGYIDVPLNLTYKIPLSANHKNSFFISAGPVFSFFYSGKITSQSLTFAENQYTNVTTPLSVGHGPDTYNTVDIGVNGRAGFEFGNVFINANFSRGLTSFYNAPYQGTFHHQLVGATLGIWLTSTTPPPPPPKDTDKDGIPDDQDLCPLQPGTAKWHGCPVPDTDHDGIDDEHDSCRTIAGVARYNGCPVPDTDHDGIDDEHDSCKTVPGVARYHGCPIPDRDGDGVNDDEDQCPDTPGTLENHGCPAPKPEAPEKIIQEKIDYAAKNILFPLGSDQLIDSSYGVLNDLADILLAHPHWHLTIEGHADNIGTQERNLALSQKRATSVKNYLVGKGVPELRITATGFGQEHPISNNGTAKGRAANRRVELKLSLEK
jgi:OmpA-OmpF porin, OOP family